MSVLSPARRALLYFEPLFPPVIASNRPPLAAIRVRKRSTPGSFTSSRLGTHLLLKLCFDTPVCVKHPNSVSRKGAKILCHHPVTFLMRIAAGGGRVLLRACEFLPDNALATLTGSTPDSTSRAFVECGAKLKAVSLYVHVTQCSLVKNSQPLRKFISGIPA